MLAHYFRSTWAGLRKAPFVTGANVLTLALGLACFIAAYGVAAYWRSGDAHHRNAERILLISQTVSASGENAATRFNPASSATLARYLRQDVTGLDAVARAYRDTGATVVSGEIKAPLDVVIADAALLEIFDFQFVAGDAGTAFARPDGVILTQAAAARLYGDTPAMGRSVLVDGRWEGTVSAVIAPPRAPSVFDTRPDSLLSFDMLANWNASPDAVARDAQDVWNRSNGFTFALRSAQTDTSSLDARLAAFVQNRVPADLLRSSSIVLRAIPIGDLTTRSLDAMLLAGGGEGSAVRKLLALGMIILAIAALNYANLATAQAAARGREVGLRKAVGAARLQIMLQSWVETLALTIVAAAVALAVLAAAAPAIRILTGTDIGIVFRSGVAAVVTAGLVAVLTIVAGAYPALVLSRTPPILALRSGRSRGGPKTLARILVGMQFASAGFLLIMVATTQIQRAYLEKLASPGVDPMVVLNDLSTLDVDEDTLQAALRARPEILGVTVTDRAPWSAGRAVFSFARSQDAATPTVPGHLKIVREDYFRTFGLAPLAGRVFDPARETRPVPLVAAGAVTPLVVDRAYAARLGFGSPQSAVDQIVYLPGDAGEAAQPFRVIGVVETEMTRLGASEVGGHVYAFAEWRSGSSYFPIVRIPRDRVAEGVAAITEVWDALAPDVAADIRFADALFQRSFRTYSRISQMFTALASVAVFIASVGLVGIAVHVTARRRHEIGVRKTLGATKARVLRMLVADFSKPVAVGNLIAWPFAWIAAEAYLKSFAERAPLTPLPFVLSLVFTLLIAWLAVGGQAWRAASLKPAFVLRTE